MCKSLEDEDVGLLLENTFSTIILHWADFDESAKQNAHELISYLSSRRREVLQEFIGVLPLLSQIPELAIHEESISVMRKEFDVRQQYEVFVRRIGHEHSSVVVQALEELAKFLCKHQGFLQTSAISEQPDPVVARLLRSVFDACARFDGHESDISRLSAKCIGLIGCVDPNRVETIRERREYIAISNFDDITDTTDFVLFCLEEVLVKVFASATNLRMQGFLSYTMQELLEKCDFRTSCAPNRRASSQRQTDELYEKWMALPESARAILTPFLKSRYRLSDMQKMNVEYPIYQSDKNYAIWLRSFVSDLLEQPHNPNAVLIFASLARSIRIQDTSLASFLLPYVVLHAIVSGTDEQRKNIEEEIIIVLNHDTAPGSHHELMNLKLCSEVRILFSTGIQG